MYVKACLSFIIDGDRPTEPGKYPFIHVERLSSKTKRKKYWAALRAFTSFFRIFFTSVFCGLLKSPEKDKVQLKGPVHIYIILAKL